MSCQLLSRGNIRTSVEQVADETAAKIVRRKVRYASFGGASKENVENGLIRYAVHCDSASTFINSAKERTGITTTGNKPLFQCIGRSVGGITEPVFSSFGTTDRQFAGLDVEVREVEPNTFRTPKTRSIKNGNESGVTNSGR